MSNLLICSLGNPGPAYANTLHSAGHVLLAALNQRLSYRSSSGPSQFTKDKSLANGIVARHTLTPDILSPSGTSSSHSPSRTHRSPDLQSSPHSLSREWTLWQSPSYMNTSGPSISRAWAAYLRSLHANDPSSKPRLVILHDEMREEKPFGTLSVRTNARGLSAKGHNGIKSVLQSMASKDWVKIGICIGRPKSRESRDVAEYVLNKMSAVQTKAVEDTADALVYELLKL